MNSEQVSALVSSAFADGEVQVDGAGANYSITVVSDSFDGMRPVARQQTVYAALREAIASGDIHAVNIQTHTLKEWAAAQD